MTEPQKSEASELRRQVERLIIENRNSLNDPTNEPYDVKGIADDVIELIRQREAEAYKKGYTEGWNTYNEAPYNPRGE